MKKPLSLILCVAMILGLAACSKNVESADVKNPVYPQSIAFDDFDSNRAIRDKNMLDEGYTKSLNNFSFTSASRILSSQDKNISYSPLSLYIALSLAGTGANGTTQAEIFSALGMKGKDANYLSKQSHNLYNLLYLDNEIGKLKIANSLWLQKKKDFKETFTDNAVQNFYASLYRVDFSKDSTGELMSKWISENTKGVLSPKMDIDKEQIMSIINTVYYKDEWMDRFDKTATKPDIFHLSDGSELTCDFMNANYGSHDFVKGEGFTKSSLGLKNNGSMEFILPDKGVSIDDLISTPEKAASLFNDKDPKFGQVIFKIPKFSFGSSVNLNYTLQAMGIKSAFENNADFKGITDDTAFISNVKQQTHVAIDEEGVEAAAFTELAYAGAAPPKDKAEMILDRPFIFSIKVNGTILFIGVVNNPTKN